MIRPGLAMAAWLCAACGGDDGGRLEWTPCSGYECAVVTVPEDHDVPDGATVDLRVMRIPARDPENRLGTLVMSTTWAGSAVDDWGSALFTSAVADSMADFDRVMFDRRGTGGSVPLTCDVGDLVEDMRAIPARPQADDWAAIDAFTEELADRCADLYGGEALRRIGAPTIARDLDAIREALGEEQISYVGYSYSTWLGAVYASAFPDRLRAGVLDSVVSPIPLDAHAYEVVFGDAAEALLARFFVECGADPGCSFHGGEGATAVEAAYDALLAASTSAPLNIDGRLLGSRDFVTATSIGLDPAPGGFADLANRLADAETGDGAGMLTAADGYYGRESDGTYDNGVDIAQIIAIRLADRPCPEALTGLATAPAAWEEQYATAPRMGGIDTIISLLCLHWAGAALDETIISAPLAAPLLIVGGVNDPGTPYVNAVDMATALDNGSHVLRYDGYGHGYTVLSDCVATAESNYLADPEGFMLTTESCE